MGLYKTGLREARPLHGAAHWSSTRLMFRRPAFIPPIGVDYLSTLPSFVGMMGNDQVGDCFIAAMYHGDQVRTKFAGGHMITQPDEEVIGMYSTVTGYQPPPGGPTDRGSDPRMAFNYVKAHGLPRVGAAPV